MRVENPVTGSRSVEWRLGVGVAVVLCGGVVELVHQQFAAALVLI